MRRATATTIFSALLALIGIAVWGRMAAHLPSAVRADGDGPRHLVPVHDESPPIQPSRTTGSRGPAQPAPSVPERPGAAEKLFANGLTKDFGTVPRGTHLGCSFPITNSYAAPITIAYLQASCGCLTAEAQKRHLGPQESAAIDVRMETGRFVGRTEQSVRVKIVGPDFESTCKLRVFAVSGADIVFLPRELVFCDVVRGQASTRTVDVEYTGPADWQVQEVLVGEDSPFAASVRPLYRRPGKIGYRLRVTLKADARPGMTRGFLQLKTNDSRDALVPMPVVAIVPTGGQGPGIRGQGKSQKAKPFNVFPDP
jgi:hypothetical protein